jgi:hypothetical protein
MNEVTSKAAHAYRRRQQQQSGSVHVREIPCRMTSHGLCVYQGSGPVSPLYAACEAGSFVRNFSHDVSTHYFGLCVGVILARVQMHSSCCSSLGESKDSAAEFIHVSHLPAPQPRHATSKRQKHTQAQTQTTPTQAYTRIHAQPHVRAHAHGPTHPHHPPPTHIHMQRLTMVASATSGVSLLVSPLLFGYSPAATSGAISTA